MARICLGFRKVKITWRINCFNMCAQPPGEPICSSNFSLDSSGETKFSLYLYPRGYSKSCNEYTTVYLVEHQSEYKLNPEYILHIDLKLFLEGDKSDPVFSVSKHLDTSETKDSNFFEISRIKRNAIFLEDNETFKFININIIMDFNPVIKGQLSSVLRWSIKDADLESLSRDLSKALENPKHHDLILKSNNGQHFSVHKSILTSRYPKFADTLGLNETRTSECHLCVDPPALERLLKYIYSGKIEVETNSCDIYKILSSDELPHLYHIFFPVPDAVTLSTALRVRHGYFIWNIRLEEFSSGFNLSNLLSCDDMLDWTKLGITCGLRTDDENDAGIGFTVHRMFTEESVYIACRIRIIGTSYVKEYDHLFIKEAEWKLPLFVSKSFLTEIENNMNVGENEFSTQYINNPVPIKISFQFNISDGKFMTEIISVHCPEVSGKPRVQCQKNLMALQRDMKYLHDNLICSDVSLHVGKKIFQAHKVILSMRSPVFSQMFEQTTFTECRKIFITDFKHDVVKSMLSYMYYGEVGKTPQDIDFVLELYAIADKYKLPELKDKCTIHCCFNLNTENAGNILVVAHLHNDPYLKAHVNSFVCMNAKAILNSKQWKTVMNERKDLAAEVLKNVLSYISRKKYAHSLLKSV